MSKTGEWVIDRMNEAHERNMGRDRDEDEMMGDMMLADNFVTYPVLNHYPTEQEMIDMAEEYGKDGKHGHS